MDLDDFRSILRNSGVDIWSLINTAISVASEDYRNEIRDRRDGIVEKLYASSPVILTRCETCNNQEPVKVVSGGTEIKEKESCSHEGKGGSPPTNQWINNNNNNNEEEEEEEDEGMIYGQRRRSMDDEQIKILDIKEQLEDPHQSEDALVNFLQDLEDMDITFKALKETDIGRHVNLLRKHPSSEVRRMVKQVVRKWKYLVDAWVKGSSPGQNAPSTFSADGDSPQQNPPRSIQNGHHQVPDFGYSPSPNTHNGSSGSEKNNSEPEPKRKVIPRRQPQAKPSQSPQVSNSPVLPNKLKEQKNTTIDPERLASARKRLHDNYQEAQNAKKQRTIQVMDLHDIPKPKNSFFSKNKGGSQAKHW
ncbi:Transcription elongation factor (TFIIS) family protein [Thalictrum thalictroides]|uniref:Transcription elongation factor (TFIIS) family protein n=1 Tax=Thalictrum thalictroides TaxID=46969 RepID=A0A7J6WU59_THATH|nr:Transcription elongation factor (TFIIS) family protein [Thalictrum thalictroides]